jgi:hypothetical protein
MVAQRGACPSPRHAEADQLHFHFMEWPAPPSPADKLGVEGRDPSVELSPLRASVCDERDHPRAQSSSSLFVHQYGQKLLKLPLALRDHQSALQQNDAQLIDQSRPLREKENEDARRLATIPGVGALVASALVAAVGRAESCERGRDLAAWLGLVPRQFTTGGKPKLLGISKRGDKYLRRQLIHGARAALPERDTPLGRWAKGLLGRAHRNVAVVAFANKVARIAWAVLRRGERFAAAGVSVAA